MAKFPEMIEAVEWAYRSAKGNAKLYTGGPNASGRPSWRVLATRLKQTVEYLRVMEKCEK